MFEIQALKQGLTLGIFFSPLGESVTVLLLVVFNQQDAKHVSIELQIVDILASLQMSRSVVEVTIFAFK